MVNRYVNGGVTILKQFRKTKEIFGESDIDDDVYAAATNTVPVNQWYWHIIAARGDQSAISAAPGFQFQVKVTYYIRFEKRQGLTAPKKIDLKVNFLCTYLAVNVS